MGPLLEILKKVLMRSPNCPGGIPNSVFFLNVFLADKGSFFGGVWVSVMGVLTIWPVKPFQTVMVIRAMQIKLY